MESSRERILSFVRDNPNVPQLKFILDDPENVKMTELSGDGILNYVYLVQSSDGETSVILKYGEEKAKYAKTEEVTLERQVVEFESLQLLNRTWPGVAPQPYCHDTKHHIIAMEDLSHMHLLGEDLTAGKVDVNLASKIGLLFARLHRSTKKENMTAERYQHIEKIYGDPQFRKDRVQFRLIDMFNEDGILLKIDKECLETYRNVMAEVTSEGSLESLRKLMLEPHAVIHGDCHPKSIFVKDDKFAIFDLEWMCWSHPAYDVGFTISWYLISMIGNSKSPDAAKIQQTTVKAVKTMLTTYFEESGEEVKTFMPAVVGFLGASLFSAANFGWLENFAPVNLEGKMAMMNQGAIMMRAYHTRTATNIESLLNIIIDNST